MVKNQSPAQKNNINSDVITYNGLTLYPSLMLSGLKLLQSKNNIFISYELAHMLGNAKTDIDKENIMNSVESINIEVASVKKDNTDSAVNRKFSKSTRNIKK